MCGRLHAFDRSLEMKKSQIDNIVSRRDKGRSRRSLLRQMAGMSLGLPLAHSSALPLFGQAAGQTGKSAPHTRPAAPPAPALLSSQDDQFLNDLEQRNFLFF